jgi:transposase-like protein
MPHRRWIAEEKIRIVLESLNTSIGVAELCRKYAVNPVVFYAWKEKFIEGGKQALTQSRRNGGGGELQAENERLKQLIGELTIANDAFKKILQGEKRRW